MNKSYKLLNIELFEEKIKKSDYVLVLKKNQLENIPEIINEFLNKEELENKKDLYNELIFNYGKSSKYIANYILKNLITI